ncbi:FAD-binding oxidoreductase [Fodinicola acaciae]|uniref:FAD-binding oxidoreductase n=1 Tax=Fodinicola acaciae TaxID=2681555 RepID=UPI0013D8D826|nr:FAD-binding oxidoreductase [Fodinicola acaciae]
MLTESSDAVDGVPVRYAARPTSTSDVADVLRHTAAENLAVVARGSGSKLSWGRPPERADVLLDLSGLTGIVDHAAGDLVLRVRAGTPMSTVVDTLAPAGQRLALATRLAGQRGPLGGTVGGTIAANPPGPLRYAYGMVRDLLIGVTVVRADGAVAHSGGAVVKNVAGYDLGKLLCGSLGTLGIVTEAVFRLHPTPESTAVVAKTVGSGDEATRLAVAIRHSQVAPSGVELNWTGSGGTIAVLVEGVAGGIEARTDALVGLLGGDAEITALPDWWHEPVAGNTILRAAVAPTGLGALLDAMPDSAVARGCAGLGTVHIGLINPSADLIVTLRKVAQAHDGTVWVEQAPAAVRQAVDSFGPVPALSLMRRVKRQFDPDRRLSPGRFVGGI